MLLLCKLLNTVWYGTYVFGTGTGAYPTGKRKGKGTVGKHFPIFS